MEVAVVDVPLIHALDVDDVDDDEPSKISVVPMPNLPPLPLDVEDPRLTM